MVFGVLLTVSSKHTHTVLFEVIFRYRFGGNFRLVGEGVTGLHYIGDLHSMCGLQYMCDLHKRTCLIKDVIRTPYKWSRVNVCQTRI